MSQELVTPTSQIRRLPVARALALKKPTKPAKPGNIRLYWFGALISAICFEGLVRKFVPQVPAAAMYFLKDIVLVSGIIYFGFRQKALQKAKQLYGAWSAIAMVAFAISVLQIFNPEQGSFVLGIVGLRAYWLWWLMPIATASILEDQQDGRRAVMVLSVASAVVAILAIFQFSSPEDSNLNTYALYQGKERAEITRVVTTGRVRVSSTFSYIAGFADFVVLVPALMLGLGLAEEHRRTRLFALIGTGLCVASMPMSGSRGPVVLSAVALVIVGWRAGFIRTQIGRRILAGGFVAALVMLYASPTAVQGLQDRFEGSDTTERILEIAEILPPVTLTKFNYPLLGIGTGMQQNSRDAFMSRSSVAWESESEQGRYLIELGVVGYLAMWFTRLGLAVALLKAASVLARRGKGAAAGLATTYALLGMQGNLTFDHIFQSLYFTGVGLILQIVVASEGTVVKAPTSPNKLRPIIRREPIPTLNPPLKT